MNPPPPERDPYATDRGQEKTLEWRADDPPPKSGERKEEEAPSSPGPPPVTPAKPRGSSPETMTPDTTLVADDKNESPALASGAVFSRHDIPVADHHDYGFIEDDDSRHRAHANAATVELATMDANEPAGTEAAFAARGLGRVGRFEIRRLLGEGAFGAVYLAHDPQLDRQVALKIAKTGVLVRESDRQRFLREARAAAQLRHPNIVPVYEFGQIDQICYIAYQFIEGKSLKSLLRAKERLEQQHAVALTGQLASALHYAHEQRIVHRDMKPDNVLLDQRGVPHITDFGCARRDDSGARYTLEGSIMGTPAYMSPEQAAGRSNEADARSDVWSLGIMLQEMLTGVLPFQGTVTEILLDIRDREVPPLRQLDRNLPKDLETICQKCLAKRPQERFQTAGILAEELERYQRGEPIQSRPISVLGRTWRWAKRNRAVASLLLAVFVTLLAGATFSTWFGLAARRAARERALEQARGLENAAAQALPSLLAALEPFQNDRRVRQLLEEQLAAKPQAARLRLALYHLGKHTPARERELVMALQQDLLVADSAEFLVLREVLRKTADVDFRSNLWGVTRNTAAQKKERFRAACALALYDPDNSGWAQIAADVVGQLAAENPLTVADWILALTPVRDQLRDDLRREFRSNDPEIAQMAAVVLVGFYADTVPLLAELVADATPAQLSQMIPHFEQAKGPLTTALITRTVPPDAEGGERAEPDANAASRVANAEMTLLALGVGEPIWRRLGSLAFPTIRALEIERLGKAGVDPPGVLHRLVTRSTTGDGIELVALLLALGQYDSGRLSLTERATAVARIAELYHQHPDSGVHSAADWLLRKWKQQELMRDDSPGVGYSAERRWYRTPHGTTLAVFAPQEAFAMGSEHVGGTLESCPPHWRRIPRRFAIATREVTVREFQHFEELRLATLSEQLAAARTADDDERIQSLEIRIEELKNRRLNRKSSTNPDDPITDVTWLDALGYCRWLGEQEQLPEDQQCLRMSLDELDDLVASLGRLEIAPTVLVRRGYRLPTAAEWEYACRAGTRTSRPYGALAAELSTQYAWSLDNSQSHSWPVAHLKPNDAGLYDMLGNAMEWCFDWQLKLPPTSGSEPIVDGTESRQGVQREIRGGSFADLIRDVHSAALSGMLPEQGDRTVGFRIAQTIE